MPRFTDEDVHYMQRALAMAARGRGAVEPNPMVGCVIVRGRHVVGEGYHRRFGGAHAEVNALRKAGKLARGATCYVTLEPCCHYGKTPPCTKALIEAGVQRVVVAMRDPFNQVRGKGLRILRAAGITVVVGLLEAQAATLNAPYLKRLREGRPWVILKWAQSLDGKIATRTGHSQWISGPSSRKYAHRLRGRVDAIIVGVGTVLADDPLLTCRDAPLRRVATRVILDPHLRTPLRCRLVRTARDVPTVVVTAPAMIGTDKARRLNRVGVELLRVRQRRGGLDLDRLLDVLGRRGMSNVLVEGGGITLGAFWDQGLVDEAIVFVAPRLIGGREAVPCLAGRGPAHLGDAPQPCQVRVEKCGGDRVYHLRFGGPSLARS